jgi:hypothetical protein
MEQETTIQHLNQLLDKIANIVFEAANSEMRNKEWSFAFLDVRGRPVRNSRLLQKYRIRKVDGTVICTLDPPDDLMLHLREVFNFKDEVLATKWCGILITVYPNRLCDVKFDYDPNCANDKTFFDT